MQTTNIAEIATPQLGPRFFRIIAYLQALQAAIGMVGLQGLNSDLQLKDLKSPVRLRIGEGLLD
jgi:hypothetical protein